MTFKELQEQVRQLRAANNWPDISPEHRAMYLVSEVGELANQLLTLSDLEVDAVVAKDIREQIGLEMYDVVWNLADLANLLEIDLEAAFAMKAELNRNREWK